MSLLKMLLSSGGQDGLHALLPRLAYTENDTGELSIDPLPNDHRKGLVAVFVMAILSTVATFILISFVTYRLVFWRGNYQRYIGYNQYIILIYNLVIADIQQSIAFLICAKWYAENKVEARTAACFLQGLWLQIGDPASGIFQTPTASSLGQGVHPSSWVYPATEISLNSNSPSQKSIMDKVFWDN